MGEAGELDISKIESQTDLTGDVNVDEDKDMTLEKTEVSTDLLSLSDVQDAPIKLEAATNVSEDLPIDNASKMDNLDTSNIDFEASEVSKVEKKANILMRED